MSRIYDDQKLANLPLVNKTWTSVWNTDQWTRQGDGVLVEGTVQARHHLCITDSKSAKKRYYVLQVKATQAHRRKFDASGQEIEPNFSQTTKVSTGYLNSSYKVEAKGKTDLLSESEMSALVTLPDLDPITKGMTSAGTVLLWLPEETAQNLEIENGMGFRFKTHGNTPFVCSLTKLEGQWSTVANFAGGEAVGASWTDKVMAFKAQAPAAADNAADDAI
ncbi:hypothetical protein BaRGS_00001956, partial [Batillaria attramentaria]